MNSIGRQFKVKGATQLYFTNQSDSMNYLITTYMQHLDMYNVNQDLVTSVAYWASEAGVENTELWEILKNQVVADFPKFNE